MKHTPGPWSQYSDTLFYTINGSDNESVAEVRTMYRTKLEAMANARLIAAAPELLEALNAVIATAESVDLDRVKALALAKSVIAKVTGNTK